MKAERVDSDSGDGASREIVAMEYRSSKQLWALTAQTDSRESVLIAAMCPFQGSAIEPRAAWMREWLIDVVASVGYTLLVEFANESANRSAIRVWTIDHHVPSAHPLVARGVARDSVKAVVFNVLKLNPTPPAVPMARLWSFGDPAVWSDVTALSSSDIAISSGQTRGY